MEESDIQEVVDPDAVELPEENLDKLTVTEPEDKEDSVVVVGSFS